MWTIHDDAVATFECNITLTRVHAEDLILFKECVTLKVDAMNTLNLESKEFVFTIWKDHNENQKILVTNRCGLENERGHASLILDALEEITCE